MQGAALMGVEEMEAAETAAGAQVAERAAAMAAVQRWRRRAFLPLLIYPPSALAARICHFQHTPETPKSLMVEDYN